MHQRIYVFLSLMIVSSTGAAVVKDNASEVISLTNTHSPIANVLPDTINPPFIAWATYVGGDANDWAHAMARDSEGNLYIAGESTSVSGLAFNGFDNSVGTNGSAFLAKYSPEGNKIWATYFGGSVGKDVCNALAIDADNNIILVGRTYSHQNDLDFNGFDDTYGGGLLDAFVAKFDASGNRLWASYLGGPGVDSGLGVAVNAAGDIYVTGITESTTGIAVGGPDVSFNGYYDGFLTKINASGQRLWSTYIGGESLDQGNGLVVDADGNVLMVGTTSSQTGIAALGFDMVLGVPEEGTSFGTVDSFIMKFDPNGNRIWGTYFGGNNTESGVALALDKDENIYLTGITYSLTHVAYQAYDTTHNGYYDTYLAKFDASGQRLWATYFGGLESDDVQTISTNQSGDVYIAGQTRSHENIANHGFSNAYTPPDFRDNGFVASYSSTGTQVWASYYHSIVFGITVDNQHNLYLSGQSETEDLGVHAEDPILDGHIDGFVTRVDDSGRTRAGYITGTLYEDTNNNCVHDEDEKALPGIVLTTEPSAYFARTDSLGKYTLAVDTGSYLVKQMLSISQQQVIEQTCPLPPGPEIVIENYYDTAYYAIGNSLNHCAQLAVQVLSGEKRRCFRGMTFITYRNNGYNTAENVNVHVDLPEHLRLIEADRAYTLDEHGTIVFNIGNLASQESGIIFLTDSVVCNNPSIRGMTQCIKAWLSPVSSCAAADPAWDMSDLSIHGTCVDDKAIFAVYNIGEGSMADSAVMRIYLDGELALIANYKLAQGDSLFVRLPAEGKTIHFEVDERPGHPFTLTETVTLEGCGTNEEDGFSTGFVNQLSSGDDSSLTDVDCQVILDSFDPNDKRVSPEGVTEEHFVLPEAKLEYTIRFQNKGTADAITIFVVDTLDVHLDPATLEDITASHAYTLSVSGQAQPVLTWKFSAINLPPEEEDEVLSQGFINFSIRPKVGLPDRTVLENYADIYFDFNEPVRTNTTQNVVHDFSSAIIPAVALNPELVVLVKPRITSIIPGAGSAQLIIYGSGFDAEVSGNLVEFNELPITVVAASSTHLDVALAGTVTEGTVKVTTLAGTDEFTYIITEVEDSFASQISVYPNPSKGSLKIHLPQGEVLNEVFIISSQGNIVSAQQPLKNEMNEYEVVLTSQPGLLMIKLKTSRGIFYKKVIRGL